MSLQALHALALALAAGETAVRATVVQVQGSVPREAGAWLAVLGNGTVLGTIGGGHLEHQAMAHARALLGGEPLPASRRFALGPSLGQCCGGVVQLSFEHLTAAHTQALQQEQQAAQALHMPVALFGGGHVGRAIVQALQPLPVRVHWIDSREEVFPSGLSEAVRTEHSEPVQAAVALLEPHSRVLIMSFSHAEDFDILSECLRRAQQRADLPFIGLIGSATKWATFRHRLEARGFTASDVARVTCPIGLPGVRGKEPEVIAAAVVAQLLQQR